MEQPPSDTRKRDSASLRVLGIFFSIMGALVLIATYEAIGNRPALIVSVCSGLVLVGIGCGMIYLSRGIAKRID